MCTVNRWTRRWLTTALALVLGVACGTSLAEEEEPGDGSASEIVVEAEDFSDQGGGQVTVEERPSPCYVKPPGGAWSTRRELIREEIPFTSYRAMQSVVVPRYSPSNFVPVAWTGLSESWIKLLRVPVPLPGE